MGARTYYVITHSFDYDGYDYYVDYIGTNFQAAANRYKWLFNYLKQYHYLNNDVEEGALNINYDIPNKVSLDRGNILYSSISDDEAWLSLSIRAVKTNAFIKNEVNNMEQLYKEEFPNSKY